MRYPKMLQPNGTIGFSAPSFGCATEPYKTAFLMAQNNFQERGYHMEFGRNCYSANGIGISDKPAVCATDLEEMYCAASNDVLISCGGGELMCEILEHMDFARISAANPKWFMGYSDNTNFTFLLNTLCDTASIYGPCAATFGMKPWHPALEDAFSLLTGQKNKLSGYSMWEKESLKTEDNPAPQYQLTEEKYLQRYMGNVQLSDTETVAMNGRLLGGCVDCLVNLLGTKFDKVAEFQKKYEEDGIIWFLECCDLNVFAMRRAMWQMEQAGWFEHVKGFLIGRPLAYGQEMMGLDQYQAVVDIIGRHKVPILMDVDLGHLPPTLPIISGSTAKVSSVGNQWEITYTFA